jgi:hypothetical protein
MFQDNFQPIASERSATTCDFTDRLRKLTHDVRLIEMAVETACRSPDEQQALVMACRKLDSRD